MKKIAIILFLFFSLAACDSPKPDQGNVNENEVGTVASRLNEAAMKRYQDHLLGKNEGNDSLEASLKELDEAITIDPTQIIFHTNKADILLALHRGDDAIQALRNAVLVKPDFSEILSLIGFLYERKDDKEEALKWYQKAMNVYDKQIDDEKLVVNSKVNKAFLLLFIENGESAHKAFKKVKEEYPKESEMVYSEQIFKDFDKETFLKGLYP